MEINLKKYFANLNTLMYNNLNFHWNVTGGLFLTLHELYQEQYEFLFSKIDHLAELMKGRDFYPPVSYIELKELSDLETLPSKDYNARETLEILLKQFTFMLELSNQLGAMIGEQNDLSLEDFFIDTAKFFDKHIYFLRQFLKQ